LKLISENHDFAAGIFDLQLPDADGLGLVEKIREHPGRRDFPMLLLSSVRFRGDDARPAKRRNRGTDTQTDSPGATARRASVVPWTCNASR